MLEYQQVGKLVGGNSVRPLLLPRDRPLSYLRVGTGEQRTETLARALLGERATEFRRRIPFILPTGEGRGELAAALGRFGLSPVLPVLSGKDAAGQSLDVYWLDRVQLLAFARAWGCRPRRGNRTARVGGLKIHPIYEGGPPAVDEVAEAVEKSWQYWGSGWEFEQPHPDESRWWRVWPNLNRHRDGPLLGRRAAARGTSAACLAPALLRELGEPHYLVVEHPFRGGALPVLAIPDTGLESSPAYLAGRGEHPVVCLDRTARDALGICDGEFCLVHPWQEPRLEVSRRRLRDRYVGSRAISANARTSARADLEKPVCRLDEESLAAIGGASGEFVTLETLHRGDAPDADGKVKRWRRVRVSQRVVAIDGKERSRRGEWEAAQTWDEGSISPGRWSTRRAGVEPEGFVDCAESLGVHPPYPTVYLNFNTRREMELTLCRPVEIRVNVFSRIAAEFGNLAWLVLIGLIGTVAALLNLSVGVIAVLLAVTLCLLLVVRAIRTIR